MKEQIELQFADDVRYFEEHTWVKVVGDELKSLMDADAYRKTVTT